MGARVLINGTWYYSVTHIKLPTMGTSEEALY